MAGMEQARKGMRKSELPCRAHSRQLECAWHVSVIGIDDTFLRAADHRYNAANHGLSIVTKPSKSIAMMWLK